MRPRRYTQPTRTATNDDHHFEKEEDNDELDRISDILANLIREANDAVHGLERERGKILEQQQQRCSVRTSSRLPRPKSFSSSSSSLVATSSSNNTMSVPPPPLRRRPFPPPPPPIETAPLLESFQRLDTSMAMVDSLSRDLSNQQEQQQQQHDHFTALFIVPLLHIPHALITTLFNAAPPSLSGMVAWACLFALGNLIMGPNNNMDNTSRRLSLPGAYHDDNTNLAGRDDEDLQQPMPITTTTSSTTSPSRIITNTSVRKRRPTIVRRSIYRKRAPPTSRQSMMPLSVSKRSSTTLLINTNTTTTTTTGRNNMPLSPNHHQQQQRRRRNSV